MRDIGLSKDEAQTEFDKQWDLVKSFGAQMSERQAELAPRTHHHDDKWLTLERQKLDAIHAANEIRDSGVIPWMKAENLGSFAFDMETWAARVVIKSYHIDRRGEHDPVLVIWNHTRQYRQNWTFSKESAEALRDQLIYELERWDADDSATQIN